MLFFLEYAMLAVMKDCKMSLDIATLESHYDELAISEAMEQTGWRLNGVNPNPFKQNKHLSIFRICTFLEFFLLKLKYIFWISIMSF